MAREKAHSAAARAPFLDQIHSAAGTSPAELVVTIGITVMVLGLSVLGLNSKFTSTGAMAQEIANDVRLARVSAVTRGAHYRVVLGTNWYRTERLQDNNNDKVWDADTTSPSRQRELEGGVTIVPNTGNVSGSASVIEFDTRGMVVPAAGDTVPSMMTVAINGSSDARAVRGASYLYIWPSGQVQLLHAGEAHP